MDQKNTPKNISPTCETDGKANDIRSARLQWSKPEIASFAPLSDAAGISYRPGDGISNQSY